MVSGIGGTHLWNNTNVQETDPTTPQWSPLGAGATSANPAPVADGVDNGPKTVAPDSNNDSNNQVVIPFAYGAGPKIAISGDFDVQIATEEESAVPSKLADLKNWDKFLELPSSEQNVVLAIVKAGKGKVEVVESIANFIINDDFKASDEATRTTLLYQCKYYPNSNTIDSLARLAGVDWFSDMDIEDKQRAAKTIAYAAKHATTKPGSAQETIINNSLDRLLSGEIRMDFHEFDDDPNTVTYGHSHNYEKCISLNIAYIPAGDNKFPDTKPASRHAVLSTLPHEVNHSVNGDKNQATYTYFQAEYRAWYVGYIAEYGKNPTRQEAYDRCLELFDMYPNIEYARTDTSWFGFSTSSDARKIIAFVQQFSEGTDLNLKDTDSADAILDLKVTSPKKEAPLPDTSISYDFDN